VEQFALEFDLTPERRIFSVSEINAAIRAMLDQEFRDIWVSGEISGLKLAASGHYYFTLKERDAQLKCVAFRSAHRYWKFKPSDGLAVLARGRIDVYEVRGEYQLLVEMLEPQGLGALQLAFEQLKKKLAAEGLFAAERKRRLPRFPRRIGIVTSPRGAAIADMIHILSRRFPGLSIRLFPALVQGPGSVEEVCRGIEYFSRGGWPEVVIVGRGGGSLEDLWTFNEEAVARHRRLLGAGDFGGGARNRRHHRRFRGRPARAHPIGGRRAGRPHARIGRGPHRGRPRQSPASRALPAGDARPAPAPAGRGPRARRAASPHRARPAARR
jgi:exodeoxyribonuclease VII large subunit